MRAHLLADARVGVRVNRVSRERGFSVHCCLCTRASPKNRFPACRSWSCFATSRARVSRSSSTWSSSSDRPKRTLGRVNLSVTAFGSSSLVGSKNVRGRRNVFVSPKHMPAVVNPGQRQPHFTSPASTGLASVYAIDGSMSASVSIRTSQGRSSLQNLSKRPRRALSARAKTALSWFLNAGRFPWGSVTSRW